MGATFVVKGSNAEYTLETGTNAWCRIEEITGARLATVLDELRGENSRISVLRQFVKGLLVVPKDATLDAVGDIIDDMGGAAVVRASLLATAPAAPAAENTPATVESAAA